LVDESTVSDGAGEGEKLGGVEIRVSCAERTAGSSIRPVERYLACPCQCHSLRSDPPRLDVFNCVAEEGTSSFSPRALFTRDRNTTMNMNH
jgi:hypothetical protein